MFYLIAVTLLWAISFSLIGEYLAGQVDSYFAVLTRILLACLLFLPLLRPHRLPSPRAACRPGPARPDPDPAASARGF